MVVVRNRRGEKTREREKSILTEFEFAFIKLNPPSAYSMVSKTIITK